MELNRTGAHPTPQVRIENFEASKWLTVTEAVIRCTERDLPRTPKTIRKWAARSHMHPESADISVRREDTENGFRWSVEAESLDRKIDEELEFELRKQPELDGTGAHQSAHVHADSAVNFQGEPHKETSKPVRTGEEKYQVGGIETELRAQLEQARTEVNFLREELTHRRQTDKALGTVIEAFKLNAEATRSQLMSGQPQEAQSEWERQRHDIVPGGQKFDTV